MSEEVYRGSRMTRADFFKIMAERAGLEAEAAPEHLRHDLRLVAERWWALADLASGHEVSLDVRRLSEGQSDNNECAHLRMSRLHLSK